MGVAMVLSVATLVVLAGGLWIRNRQLKLAEETQARQERSLVLIHYKIDEGWFPVWNDEIQEGDHKWF